MRRRTFIKWHIAPVLAAALPAWANSFPLKPVAFIVPYSPGTGVDLTARLMAERLSKKWKVPVIVENKVGANGIIGADQVAKAPADGHTLLFMSAAHLTNPSMYKKMPYDTVKDFSPVVRVCDTLLVLVVPKNSPANSLRELLALAKAKPGELTYASGGNGSATHLAPALMNAMADTNILHVPYKGGDRALTDTVGGQVSMAFTAVATAVPQIRAGNLKAIAVSGPNRSQLLPDVPTLHEAGLPGFNVVAWNGILAPAGTPDEVVRRISADVVETARAAEFGDALRSRGLELNVVGVETFPAFYRADAEHWAKIVSISGAKVE